MIIGNHANPFRTQILFHFILEITETWKGSIFTYQANNRSSEKLSIICFFIKHIFAD